MRRTRVVSLGLTLAVGLVAVSAAPQAIGLPVDAREAAGVTGAQCYVFTGANKVVCASPGGHFTCYPNDTGPLTINDFTITNYQPGMTTRVVPCPCGSTYYVEAVVGSSCTGS